MSNKTLGERLNFLLEQKIPIQVSGGNFDKGLLFGEYKNEKTSKLSPEIISRLFQKNTNIYSHHLREKIDLFCRHPNFIGKDYEERIKKCPVSLDYDIELHQIKDVDTNLIYSFIIVNKE